MAAAVVLLLILLLVLKQSESQAFPLFVFVLILYTPISYYTDKWAYNRRQRNKARERDSRRKAA